MADVTRNDSSSHARTARGTRTRRRWRFGAGLVLFFIGWGVAVFLADRPQRQAAISASSPDPLAALENQADALFTAPAAPAAEREVFPYSVIEGGAHSVGELKQAIWADSVVAAHYSNFDLAHTRVERLRAPRLAHVSYRIGDSVLWTRKPIVLPAGEQILTDGVHVARTRCGNQLSETPGATSPEEPAAAAMDKPTVRLLPTRSAERHPTASPLPLPLPLEGAVLGTAGRTPMAAVTPGSSIGATGSTGLISDSGPIPPADDKPPTVDPGTPPAQPADDPLPPANRPVPPSGQVPPQPPGKVPPSGPVPPAPLPPTGLPPIYVPPTELPPLGLPPTELPPLGVPPTELPPLGEPPVGLPPLDVPHFPPETPLVPPDQPHYPLPPGDEVPPPMTPVPEPGTGLMLVVGAAGYAVRRLKGRAGSRAARPGTPRLP